MEPAGRSIRPRAGFGLYLLTVPAMAILLFSAAPSAADIYRWVDEQGTIHFTDELSNVPPAARKSATLQVREAPETGGSLTILRAPPPAPGSRYAPGNGSASPGSEDSAATREDLLSRIEQVKAKIDAKERHIRAVDEKQSLAVNPLRNRFVEKADLDLYRKYKSELPEDRRELQDLEDSLSSLR